ncbi:MAG TPA: hypothetical protein VG605_11655 [Puia sp.]|nr:hypothetical protein [Puia sp.]
MMKPSLRMLCVGLLVFFWMLPAASVAGPTDTTGLRITLVSAPPNGPATIRVTSPATANIRLEWHLLLNGVSGQKGVLPVYVSSRHASLVRLPVKLSSGDKDDAEAWLRIICRRTGAPRKSAPIATVLLPLRPWHGDRSIPPAGELNFTDSNGIFMITAPNTQIQFDKQTGWLLHYEAGHTLLMGDTAGVQPTLWPGIQPRLQLFSTSTGTQLVIVRAEYTLPETWSLLHMSYTINAAGEMLIGETLEADTSQHLPDSVHRPPLPCFGMRWLLPVGLDTVSWFGSIDSAAAPGIFHEPLTTPVTDPRETGFTNVRWLTLTGPLATGLRIIADSNFLHLRTVSVSDSAGASRTALDVDALPPFSDNIQYTFKVTSVLPRPPAPAPAAHIHPARR